MACEAGKDAPRDSGVFCVLPWTSLNIQPNGDVFACCLAEAGRPAGSLRDSPLTQIWNGEGLRRMRLNMAAGRPSPECAKCYENERVGVRSLRQDMNDTLARHTDRVGKTQRDGSLAAMDLAYLDIRFSNVCNLKCRYCNHFFSTTWFEDHKEFGMTVSPIVITPTKDPEALWRQLEPLLRTVEMVYFSGGEPLIAPEHYRMLQALVDSGRSRDIFLTYTTNFSTLSHGSLDLTELWRKFKKVHVKASLDAMGARGEYIRKKLRWEDALHNRELMLERCPDVGFSIGPTLSVFNALHLPDFHWDWLERGFVEPDDFYINILTDPAYFSAKVLPPDMKRAASEKYERFIERVAARFGTSERVTSLYRGAAASMMAEDRPDLLRAFKRETRALDAIRGERLEEAFPELAVLMA